MNAAAGKDEALAGAVPSEEAVRVNMGSAPSPAQVPTEADGVLEVEVLAAGGQPVPGASVRLHKRDARDTQAEAEPWRLVGTGQTDARGVIRLASGPGRYLVAVRARGHAPLFRDVVRPFGEPRTSLRLTLEPGQSLAGRTVVQGTEEPLPLVELVLTAHGRELEFWQRAEAPAEERVYATSDERGRFLVGGLAPGVYQLEARAPGYARAVLGHVKVPMEEPLTVALRAASVIEGFVVDARGLPAADAEVRVSGESAQVVTAGAGGGFSVEVEPGAHTVSARRGEEAGGLDAPVLARAGKTVREVRIQLGPGAVLEGRVVARSSGAPVAKARVDVSPHADIGDSGRTMTDGEGHFLVSGLAAGGYDVRVSAPGFSQAWRRGLMVHPGERFPVSIVLTGTGSVEGEVRDTAGRPVTGARVMAPNRSGEGAGLPFIESRTDALGRYRLQGIAAGTQYLTARREGSTAGVSKPVEVGEVGTARADFTLEGTGTVEGVVRVARGPLPTGQLEVTAVAQGEGRFGASDIGRATVGVRGDFRMELPPGTYGLLLGERRGSGTGGSRQVQVEEGRTIRVELTWEEPPGGNELQGVVLEPDGAPSPRAFVTLASQRGTGPAQWMMGPTDDEGRFSLGFPPTTGANKGRLTVVARNGGRVSEVMGVKPGDQGVVVRLRPAALVRGRVVRTGEPVRGFIVSYQLESGFLPGDQEPWEFPGERFELRDVPAEPVKLEVWTPDGSSGEVRISPSAGGTLEVDIPLVEGQDPR
ncbi:carboxypeptidase regulatory-like domain-containing protein [Archangium violaceum]|uniref:carboxypeptidase regulatory-like domain-containing protein n=1 Tax=Archangium violaceum TaxID=83451 RepID=UPI002B2F95F7|nr:carboxypeptidase regulatory-like domain-containing protein [Archangium gephyra]